MSILDAIANPRMADISGALDAREARMERDKKRRDEIRLGQLVSEAVPGLTPGSPLHAMALEMPREFAVFAKSIGVPLNSGDQMQAFADDTKMLYTLAQNDPREAYDYALQAKAQRNQQGIETPQIDKFIGGMQEDPARTMTGLFLTHRQINGEKGGRPQSSENLPGGLTKIVTASGGVQVKDAAGRLIEGDEAVKAIREAEQRGVNQQRDIYSARREGTLSVDSELKPGIEREVATEKGRGTNVAKAEDRAAISQEDKLKLMPKATNAANAAKSRFDNNIGIIDEIEPKIDALTAGFAGSMLSTIKGSEAKDISRALDTIKANIGFNELNEMRQNSPTGGALGNVTERELQFLQSVVASLEQDQSPEQLKKNLGRVKKAMTESWGRVSDAYEDEYGTPLVMGKAVEQKPKLSGQDQQAYEWAQANPSDPRSAAILQRLGVQ